MPEKSPSYPTAEIYDHPIIPERNLLAACLERGIMDILNPPQSEGGSGKYNAHNAQARSAHAWFRSTSTEPFSFLWICHYLDLSPKRVRRAIYEYHKKGIRYEFNMHRTCEGWESSVKKKQPLSELP